MSNPRHQHDTSMADSASIAGSAHVPKVITTNGTLVPNCTVPNALSNVATLNTPPSQTPTNPSIDAASPCSVDEISLYLALLMIYLCTFHLWNGSKVSRSDHWITTQIP